MMYEHDLAEESAQSRVVAQRDLPHDGAGRAREGVLGFVDDAAHDVAGGDELVDRADALTRRVALRSGSTAVFSSPPRCSALAASALPICSGNLLQLLGVLLDVLRPLVADRAQRLAGEAAADHRVVLVRRAAARPCSRRRCAPRASR